MAKPSKTGTYPERYTCTTSSEELDNNYYKWMQQTKKAVIIFTAEKEITREYVPPDGSTTTYRTILLKLRKRE